MRFPPAVGSGLRLGFSLLQPLLPRGQVYPCLPQAGETKAWCSRAQWGALGLGGEEMCGGAENNGQQTLSPVRDTQTLMGPWFATSAAALR